MENNNTADQQDNIVQSESPQVKTADFNKYLSETQSLERDYIGELLHSRTTAWRVVAALSILCLLAIVAAIAGLQRPPPTPFVLRVDNATGAVDVITALHESALTYGEVVDTYWLNLYVLNRESYDYNNIQMLYETTALLSTEQVQKEYYNLYDGPQARDKILGSDERILVTVRSITPIKQGGQAVVRFTTQHKNMEGRLIAVKHFIATVSYKYTSSPMHLADRRINPLGFQITSYRTDLEALTN